jgi:hypothetical protein
MCVVTSVCGRKMGRKNSAIHFCRGTLKLFINIYICIILFRPFGWIILMQKINIPEIGIKTMPKLKFDI